MTTISPTAECKIYRYDAKPGCRWFDNPNDCLRQRYQSIFSEEGQYDEPLSPPIHDPQPPVHTD